LPFICGFDLIRRSSGDYKDSKPQDQMHQNLPKDDLRLPNILDQGILPALALILLNDINNVCLTDKGW
jgi:hypothetical protein